MTLSAVLVVPTVGASVSGEYEYTVKHDGTVIIDYYDGNSEEVEIPSVIEDRTVTEIGDTAFIFAENVKKVTVPSTVKAMGEGAIYTDSLETIVIDPENKYFTVENNVIYNTSKTKLVQYAPCKKGESYTVPDSVTEVCPYAFYKCAKLKKIVLPSKLKSIGAASFAGCLKLSSINFPSNIKTIPEGAFALCQSIKTMKMSNKVTEIGNSAFLYCKGLTSITLSTHLKTIGPAVFYSCDKLKSVTVPKTVTKVEDSAFGYTFDYNIRRAVHLNGFKMKVYNNTSAYKYAVNNKISYDVVPESVKISPSKIQLKVKKTYKLNPVVSPSKAKTTFKYTSSNSKVAKVNSSGKITALKKGTTTITVTTYNGKKDTVKVTVKKK
jgi:uncharacterized protein YjdB